MKLSYYYFLLTLFMLPFFCIAQQSKIDSLQMIISKNKRDTVMAKALYNLANEYMRRDITMSKKYSWQTKELSKEIRSNTNLASSFSILVNIHRSEATIDSVNFYLDALKNLAESADTNDSNRINLTYYSTLGLNLKRNGKSREALPYLLKAYDYAVQLKNTTEASGQAINIGNSYSELGEIPKSLEYYLLALKGFERTKNKTGQAFCYNNISSAYYKLNRLQESLAYLKKSIKLKEELGDKKGMATGEQNMGNILMGLEDYDNAENHFLKAIAINAEFKNNIGLMENYYNLARLKAISEPKSALSYFEKSKKFAVDANDNLMVSKIELEMLAVKKDMDEKELISETEALTNLQVLKSAGNKYQEVYGYQNLANYYAKNKEFEKALNYTNKFYEMRDSLNNNDVQAKFKTIEEQYNKEKNEKQIALLQKDKQINAQKLKQQRSWITIFGLIILLAGLGIWAIINRSRIKQQMKELKLRNEIAADLHDEVGSSLSSIYMLSQLAGSNGHNERTDILNKVKVNAKETMEKMGDIVWMIKPSENNLESLKDRMQRFVQEIITHQGIVCDLKIDNLFEVKLTVSQKKNLYLIFKEAINNAVKYSNTNKLEVKVSKNSKELKMVIQDYGKGFEEEKIRKGNGIENMRSRANELKGKLMVDSHKGEGTKIQLNFPVN